MWRTEDTQHCGMLSLLPGSSVDGRISCPQLVIGTKQLIMGMCESLTVFCTVIQLSDLKCDLNSGHVSAGVLS